MEDGCIIFNTGGIGGIGGIGGTGTREEPTVHGAWR